MEESFMSSKNLKYIDDDTSSNCICFYISHLESTLVKNGITAVKKTTGYTVTVTISTSAQAKEKNYILQCVHQIH
eukprot:748464-Ditylum_brightwellii.AAC.1